MGRGPDAVVLNPHDSRRPDPLPVHVDFYLRTFTLLMQRDVDRAEHERMVGFWRDMAPVSRERATPRNPTLASLIREAIDSRVYRFDP